MSETIANQIKELGPLNLKLSPFANGKYKLPDNTILKVRNGKYEHIGHRDKKKQRKLLKMQEDHLRGLLQLPGYGSYKMKRLSKMNKIELANLMNPKPVVYFLWAWIEGAYDQKAKKIKSLMKKATVFETTRKGFRNERKS
jgi:endonuclease III-like uncharacterized protein